MRLSLERNREELQRHLASSDSQLAIARARLEDGASEVSSLGVRLASERAKVRGSDCSLVSFCKRC